MQRGLASTRERAMSFELRDVVSNVEASLGFTVSLKLVETIVAVLRIEGSASISSLVWKSRAGFFFLGRSDQQEPPSSYVLWSSLSLVACIVTLLLVMVATPVSPNKPLKPSPPSSTLHELLSTASHITTLAVARIGLAILVVPSDGDGATAFSTGRSLVQTMFGAVSVSCITALATKQMSSSTEALGMLFSNVQRAFAQQITALVPDQSSRRTVAAFGLCLFPTFAGVLLPPPSPSDDEGDAASAPEQVPQTLQDVLLGVPSAFPFSKSASCSAGSSLDSVHRTFSSSLLRMWVSGLCTTWLNISIDLLLASLDGEGVEGGNPEMFRVSTRVVVGLSICIVWRALHGLVRGVQLFRGYVEWNVASALLGTVQQAMSSSSASSSSAAEASARLQLLVLSASCVAFFFFDAVRRDILLISRAHTQVRVNSVRVILEQAVETLHSVSSIIFTNSLISWAMELFSDPSDPDDGGIGDALATLVVGIVVSRILLNILSLRSSPSSSSSSSSSPG
jgi:hypothetical protein